MTYTARLIALPLVLNAMMGGVVFKSLSDSRDEYERDATVTTQNVSRLVSVELEGDFNLADAALRVVTDEIDVQTAAGKPSKAHIEAAMQRLIQRNPTLLDFVVSDRKGDLINGLGSGNTQPAINVSDRPYFTTLRDRPQVGLVVSDLVKSKIDGQSVMVLARRLNDASGAFAGLALVAYDVDVIQSKLASYALGGNATITVRSEQLSVIARHPPGTTAVTSPGATKVANVFSMALQKNPLQGTYAVGRDSIDGIPRLHSYTKSEKYPFYVNVGLARSDYLGQWEREVKTTTAMALAFALTTLLGAFLLHKAWRRRDQVESELHAQRDQLQQVVWSAALGTWQWNVLTGETTFNTRMAEIAGLTSQELGAVTNVTWAKLAHPDDIPRYKETMRHCLTRQTDDFQCESRVRHKDGHWVWVLDQGRVIDWSGNGRAAVLTGTRQDISDRKFAEERQIYAVLDASPDGALLVNNAGAILYANKKSGDVFGAKASDLMGMHVEALVPNQYRKGHASLRKHYSDRPTARGMAAQNNIQGLRRDGSVFPAEINLNPFQLNHERVVIATIADISEQVAAQESITRGAADLRQANETLEQRVEQRTRELALALDDAEQAKQSRGEFLAKMSHEIRTPMNAVLGLVYLALRKQPDATLKPYLEKIRQSGQHMLGIINDILDFTKIDAGKLELEAGVVDIEQLVQHVLLLTEGKAVEKGLAVSSAIARDVPRKLRGDSLRIAQVLINYANNAIKFTERGGISIHVSCPADSGLDGRMLVRFEVRDTGMGVTEEQRSRLFQDFEQADNSTTRKFGGTGLGLSISKQLAGLMGGEVGVTSTPGSGSTFWFTARLAPAFEGTGADAPSAPEAMPALLETLRGKHVLVVDDNSLNLEVAQGVLEGVGIHVAQACDGALALDILRNCIFDCVLMDVHMPVMDGLEATRKIRADPALAAIPVLAMTANARREDHLECLHAGMDDVVTKPFDPDQLFITLAKWISSRNVTRAMAAGLPPSAMAKPAPTAADDLPEWDIAYLQRIVGDNAATQRRLLEKFQVSARELVPAVDFAVAAQQWAEAGERAHKLKSSARAVGAMRLGAMCEAIEAAGRAGQALECRLLATAMTDALARVDEKITTYLTTA